MLHWMRASEIECMQIAEIFSAGRGEYKYMTVLHWWYIAALFLSFLDQKMNDEAECYVDDENDDSGRCTEREPIANGTFEGVEQDSISCHIIIMMMMLLIIMMKTFNHIMMNRHHDDDGKDHKDTKFCILLQKYQPVLWIFLHPKLCIKCWQRFSLSISTYSGAEIKFWQSFVPSNWLLLSPRASRCDKSIVPCQVTRSLHFKEFNQTFWESNIQDKRQWWHFFSEWV